MLSKLSLLLNARLTSSDVSLLCLKSILRLTNALFKATLSSIVPIAPFSIQIALINDFLGFLGSLLRIVGKDCSSSLRISLVVGTNHLLCFDWFSTRCNVFHVFYCVANVIKLLSNVPSPYPNRHCCGEPNTDVINKVFHFISF